MRVLITGSEGKIAKELIKILGDHQLMLVDKKGGDSVKLNLATDSLDPIKDFSPEVIFHLAASFERTDESASFHKINYEDNILASYRLNQVVAKLKNVSQYIFASSYLVYDPSAYLSYYPKDYPVLLSESSAISPRNLIGASKLYVEKEIDYLARNIQKDMLVTHARIFRVFGEGGQEFISRLIEWKKMGIPVDIWNMKNRFDYVHTSDCASALKAMIGVDGVYNIGYGVATSIKDIVNTINPEIRHFDKDELFESSCADTSKAEEELGWTPKVGVIDWVKGKL